MTKISNIDELKESILLLEIKQAEEYELLKIQFTITSEQLKPINLIKRSISGLIGGSDQEESLVNSVIGVTAGSLSKKMAIGSTHNPIKQILGTILQIGITSLVTKNGDAIRSGAMNLIGQFLRKK